MESSILTILLGILLNFIALAIGLRLIRYINIRSISDLEKWIFGVSIGLAIIACGIYFLGIIRLFKPNYIALWIFTLLLLSISEFKNIFTTLATIPKEFLKLWEKINPIHKGLVLTCSTIFLLIMVQVLTPPWDYDGLTYHLEGPRQFLLSGQIGYLPYISQANGPMLIEMLFSIGVAWGIDSLAKFIHLTYAVLLILATYSLGEHCLGKNKGWMPSVILIGTPMVISLAYLSYVDLGWSLYTTLSLYAILIWSNGKDRAWLILAGIFSGFMIGSKILSLGYLLIFLLIILWIDRKNYWRVLVRDLSIFGWIAILIGFTWYLKNWILTGNPFYPLLFGGPGWPMERVQILTTLVRSYGTGNSFLDYLFLPINIFINHGKYSTFLYPIEIPNPLFILLLFFPIIKYKSHQLNLIFAFTILGFSYWAIGSQQTRFLVPLFAGCSILAVKIFEEIRLRLPFVRLRRMLFPGISGGMVIISLLVMIYIFNTIQPHRVVLGIETRDEFLYRFSEFPFILSSNDFIQANLAPDDKILMMWEGRSYYCNNQCIPDSDNSLWTYLVSSSMDSDILTKRLQELGISHFLINYTNAEGVINQDKSRLHEEALLMFKDRVVPKCTNEIYQDKRTGFFKFTCLSPSEITNTSQ